MISLGFVAFNTITNDFLANITRTHYGSKRSYVGSPKEAKRFKSVRRAKESFIDSPRRSEMQVFELLEDLNYYYLTRIGGA